MRIKAATLAALVVFAPAAKAQSVLETPGAAGALMANACVTQSLDFPAIFSRATTIADQIGLPVVTNTDKVAVYGDPAASHIVFTREIDALACALTVPAPAGSRAFFETVRTRMQDMVASVYPEALSVDSKDPSPHVESHQWVFSIPRNRHFAASLDWQTERGVTLAIGYRQIYE